MAFGKTSAAALGLLLAITGIIAYTAYRTRRVPTPKRRWRRFNRRDAVSLDAEKCDKLQGLYSIDEGKDCFGEAAVARCSYTVERGRKVYHLSFFCQKSGLYIICEGRQYKGDILLYGHWRKAAANGTGLVRLEIKGADSSDAFLVEHDPKAIWLRGAYGSDNHRPHKPLSLRYQRPLPNTRTLEIIGHRGGCRNVDFLPVSENSLEMMKMAARLGATGVEIDVRHTKDGVPVIFHDSFLSVHTVRGKIYGGLIHNYTLQELKKIELRKGGRVPTLDECLHTILHKTPLRTVWLDIKKECDLEHIYHLQEQYHQRAAMMGRDLSIYIGVPDDAVLKCFTALENHKDIPSLTELDIDTAFAIGANVWAPQYTNGFQTDKVSKIQAAGGKAFVWSLDAELLIDLYITEGGFDGLVTNTPAVVAHWHYTQQTVAAPATAPTSG